MKTNHSNRNCIHNLDMFGNLFNFTINKKTKFTTNLGSIFSIITFLIIIITCIIFGSDFYNRINPRVLMQTAIPETVTKVKVSNKNFTISWRIEDSDGLKMDFLDIFYPTIFYYGLELNPITKNLEFSQKIRLIPIRRCNEIMVDENFLNLKNPENWYCFDLDFMETFIGGSWDADFLFYFTFNLNLCERDEIGKRTTKCSDLNKLKTFLNQRIFFSINLPSVNFIFTDYDKPMKIEYKNYYSHLNQNLIRSDFCYFNFPVINDDKSWIFSDYSEDKYISLKNCDRNYHIKFDNDYYDDKSDDLLFGIDLYLDKSNPYYIRSFMKFQELAAIVGGFVKIITLCFGFINFYFNSYERDRFLIDYFFNIFENGGKTKTKNIENLKTHSEKVTQFFNLKNIKLNKNLERKRNNINQNENSNDLIINSALEFKANSNPVNFPNNNEVCINKSNFNIFTNKKKNINNYKEDKGKISKNNYLNFSENKNNNLNKIVKNDGQEKQIKLSSCANNINEINETSKKGKIFFLFRNYR